MGSDKWGQSKYTVVFLKLLYIYSDPIYLTLTPLIPFIKRGCVA